MGIRNTWRLAFCFLLWIAAFAPRLARAGTDSPRPPEVSIVIPANNEAANLPPLVDKIMRLPLSRGFEVVLVDDASTDDTPRIAQRLSARYPNFVYVRTGTSSGQGGALRAGIAKARGSILVTIDGDGQHDPADIPRLVDAIENQGADYVAPYRAERNEALFRKAFTRFFSVYRRVLLGDPTRHVSGFAAYRSKWTRYFPPLKNFFLYLPAIIRRNGGKVTEIDVRALAREAGHSHYGARDAALTLCEILYMRLSPLMKGG